MKEPIEIRPVRLSDADAIGHLTAQLGYDVEAAAVSARLSRILVRPDHQFVVAERESRVVGWLHATVWEFVETAAFVVIAGLAVDRSVRRQGIGRVLLAHAEQWAAGQGCSVVRLWSSTGRTEAHKFYERLGYINIKTRFAFGKSVDAGGETDFQGFVPRVSE